MAYMLVKTQAANSGINQDPNTPLLLCLSPIECEVLRQVSHELVQGQAKVVLGGGAIPLDRIDKWQCGLREAVEDLGCG